MKFSRELLLDAHQGTVLLDVSVLVGIDTEREGGRKTGRAVNKNRATILAWESLPGPECFSFTSDKVNTEPATFVCLFRETGFWCHSTKWDGANRNVMIKNKGCFRCFFFFFFLTEWYATCYTISSWEPHGDQNPCSPRAMLKSTKGHRRVFGWIMTEKNSRESISRYRQSKIN